MPTLQRDANNNTVTIKTLNDITAGDPLPVMLASTISATDTAATDGSLMARLRYIATNGTGGVVSGVETRLGATSETATTTDTKRYLARFTAFLGILGTTSDTASASGTGGGTGIRGSTVDIAAVAVTTTATIVAETVTADWSYLSLWILNTGAVALSELKTEAGLSASYSTVRVSSRVIH